MIQIIDDAVDIRTQDEILQYCYNQNVNYAFNKYSTSPYSKIPLRSFTHPFYSVHGSLSPFSNIFSQPAKIVVPDKEMVRARIFLQMPRETSESGEFHVDFYEPHYTMLYYANDTDGDTIFSTIHESQVHYIEKHLDKFNFVNETSKIYKQVSPKKGRCVLFDGLIYHASSTPTENERFVINFNFKP
jgi:hypothetical protein